MVCGFKDTATTGIDTNGHTRSLHDALPIADWMEAEERGWSGVDKVVCSGCVDDSALKRVVRDAARSGRCDYCGNRRKVAAVEALQEAVYAAVWTYYHEPTDAGVPWDRGFVIDPIDIEEVFYGLGFDGHPAHIERKSTRQNSSH